MVCCFVPGRLLATGFHALFRKRVTPALLVSLCGGDHRGGLRHPALLLEGRCQALPLWRRWLPWAWCFALWGCRRETAGLYECYRTAAMDDEPPYLVTDTAGGRLQAARAPWRAFSAWPRAGASDALAHGGDAAGDPDGHGGLCRAEHPWARAGARTFCWCWSAHAGRCGQVLPCPLPTACPFPGWLSVCTSPAPPWQAGAGAERVCRKRTMILTDSDLFPPGTVTLNGMKLFGEELGKVVVLRRLPWPGPPAAAWCGSSTGS